MKATGPTLRRRNHAWLQMRSPERRAARLARRQELDDSADDADTSSDESSDSEEESEEESDDESGAEPTKTVTSPLVSASEGVQAGRGAALLPSAGAKLAAGASQLAAGDGEVESDGAESDGEESADESTSAPATATPPPPAVTSVAPGRELTTLTRGSTSLDELVTSLTQASPTGKSTSPVTPVVSATNGPSISVPATGAAQSEVAGGRPPPDRHAHEREGSGFGVVTSSQNQLSSGAVAGIVIGVLAFIALLAGAALLWRKRRRDRGLPFFPEKRFRLGDDDGESHAPSIGGPLPGRVGGHDHVKTNTQIMDELMRAAYSAENGTNDMEGAFAPAKQPPPQQQQQTSAFMDEKAYVALAGPPTPAPVHVSVPPQQKPLMKWLSEIKTPTQPNGPGIPPSPEMPPSATLPRPGLPNDAGGGRVPEPPRPAYFGRDTMTTETTNTSVRWYG
ncbi:hypothetical protein C8A03DRAFT_36103 [Achaetomium macrosporum]|uniref:Uncharacterized protein n=1 Tax=Achaetomium macrosporum TaxID=79813 RepID=A0AAN7C6A9_9PEZI|nr:hypothetical protein C8A03DRAFT_36103 [Achaetomium macrosporum]